MIDQLARYIQKFGLRYNRYLTNLVFSPRTVSYESSFFPLGFMARAFRAWAINVRGKIRSVTYSTDLELG